MRIEKVSRVRVNNNREGCMKGVDNSSSKNANDKVDVLYKKIWLGVRDEDGTLIY